MHEDSHAGTWCPTSTHIPDPFLHRVISSYWMPLLPLSRPPPGRYFDATGSCNFQAPSPLLIVGLTRSTCRMLPSIGIGRTGSGGKGSTGQAQSRGVSSSSSRPASRAQGTASSNGKGVFGRFSTPQPSALDLSDSEDSFGASESEGEEDVPAFVKNLSQPVQHNGHGSGAPSLQRTAMSSTGAGQHIRGGTGQPQLTKGPSRAGLSSAPLTKSGGAASPTVIDQKRPVKAHVSCLDARPSHIPVSPICLASLRFFASRAPLAHAPHPSDPLARLRLSIWGGSSMT